MLEERQDERAKGIDVADVERGGDGAVGPIDDLTEDVAGIGRLISIDRDRRNDGWPVTEFPAAKVDGLGHVTNGRSRRADERNGALDAVDAVEPLILAKAVEAAEVPMASA